MSLRLRKVRESVSGGKEGMTGRDRGKKGGRFGGGRTKTDEEGQGYV